MIHILENSTIHGVTHIHSTKNKIFKIFWMLLFIFGITGIVVNVIFVTKKYLSSPVSVSYTLDHEPFIWPEFTFCIPNAPIYMKINSSEHRYWVEISNKSKEFSKFTKKERLFKIIKISDNGKY